MSVGVYGALNNIRFLCILLYIFSFFLSAHPLPYAHVIYAPRALKVINFSIKNLERGYSFVEIKVIMFSQIPLKPHRRINVILDFFKSRSKHECI